MHQRSVMALNPQDLFCSAGVRYVKERAAVVIPVTSQPEPTDFDSKVRIPGLRWLGKHGLAPDQPPPDSKVLPQPFGVGRNEENSGTPMQAYAPISASSLSGLWGHNPQITLSPNRVRLGQAYEWSNYRLSCLGMNRNKNRFEDILDPFEIQPDTFILNLASGLIAANPALAPMDRAMAQATIRRLRLDAPETNRMRASPLRLLLSGRCNCCLPPAKLAVCLV